MPLGAFQGLDMRFFVDTEHNGVLRRGKVKPDDVGRFGSELRVCTDAPSRLSLQLNLLLPKHPTDLCLRDVSKLLSQDPSVPHGVRNGRRFAQLFGYPLGCFLLLIATWPTCPRLVHESRNSVLSEA